MISDSQFIVRHGLVHLMENHGYNVVHISDNKEDLFLGLDLVQAHILIIDYNKVSDFSISDFLKIHQIQPDLNIIAISDYTHKKEVLQAIEYGVLSFVTKDCDEREIVDAVIATAKQEKFFCNKVLDLVLEGQIESKLPNCKPSLLSDREIEIVETMAEGKKAKEIANELDLSIHTVYTHQKNIMKKLNVNSSTDVILFAINKGLVST